MPVTLNDGDVDYGSTTISIGGVDYLAESVNPTKNVTVVDIPDTVGAPRKQVIVSGKVEGTMTLQLETTASAIPSPGGLFGLPARYNASGSAFTCSITTVSTPRSVNDYAKVECGFVQKLT